MLTNTENFQVKKTVGSSWITDEDDVQKTKSALSDTGDYKAPDWGITGIPDKEMFDGLKSFQKREGLKVDGVMKPGGPTEERLRQTGQTRNSKAQSKPRKRTDHDFSAGIVEGEWDETYPWMPSIPGRHEPTILDGPIWPEIDWSKTPPIHHVPNTGGQTNQRRGNPDRDRSQDAQVALAPLIPAIVAGASGAARYGPKASRALTNLLKGLPPLIGAAEEARRQSEKSTSGAGQYPSPIPQPPEDEGSKPKRANMDSADPLPPVPGIQPPDEKLPDRSESPSDVVELPDLTESLPETNEPAIFVFPAIEPNEFGDGIIERKGNEATRKELECVRDYFELQYGWIHTDGGRYGPRHKDVLSGDFEEGDELEEYHVPGHFRSLKGGRFSDLTFEVGEDRFVHVQTVDVDKNGQTTQREWDAAEAIRRATGHSVLLIAKGAQLDRIIKRCKELQFN